jgi:hypothetical protein
MHDERFPRRHGHDDISASLGHTADRITRSSQFARSSPKSGFDVAQDGEIDIQIASTIRVVTHLYPIAEQTPPEWPYHA